MSWSYSQIIVATEEEVKSERADNVKVYGTDNEIEVLTVEQARAKDIDLEHAYMTEDYFHGILIKDSVKPFIDHEKIKLSKMSRRERRKYLRNNKK